jgi:HAD superfamily phosphatase (TIGR01668 family)
VSNTAGTDSDKQQKEAMLLEANTGIKVLQHSTKKPGCKEEVMSYFRAHPDAGVTRPEQIAVVGDRLSTDIMMANMMGSYGVWVRDGVTGRGFVSTLTLYVPHYCMQCTLPCMSDDTNSNIVCEDGRQVAGFFIQEGLRCA